MKANYHTHSTWCDGSASPETMIVAAIEKGFGILGFSSHSDMLSDITGYKREIRSLAAKYAGYIDIRCGVEAEFDTGFVRGDFDYVIGSVHYLTAPDGARISVDASPNDFKIVLDSHFGGDARLLITEYFRLEREMIATYDCDFWGHLDLVRKFNKRFPWFDESADWYLAELDKVAEAVAFRGLPVEINTGAIARGWLDEAYPSPVFREMLHARGVNFVLSSDAHSPEALDCAFERFPEVVAWDNFKIRR